MSDKEKPLSAESLEQAASYAGGDNISMLSLEFSKQLNKVLGSRRAGAPSGPRMKGEETAIRLFLAGETFEEVYAQMEGFRKETHERQAAGRAKKEAKRAAAEASALVGPYSLSLASMYMVEDSASEDDSDGEDGQNDAYIRLLSGDLEGLDDLTSKQRSRAIDATHATTAMREAVAHSRSLVVEGAKAILEIEKAKGADLDPKWKEMQDTLFQTVQTAYKSTLVPTQILARIDEHMSASKPKAAEE